MGVDLLLKRKGEIIADLGRAYNYIEPGESEPSADIGEVDQQIDFYHRQTLNDIMRHFDFVSTVQVVSRLLLEKDADFKELKEEIESIRNELAVDLDGLVWDLVKYGERRMLANLISECPDFYLELS